MGEKEKGAYYREGGRLHSNLLPQKGKKKDHGGAVSSRVCVGYLSCLSLLPAPEEVRKLVF